MALMLGIQHGFDLDHLATIDSITRTISNDFYVSRIVGLLFSLGHGLVVILLSLVIGSGMIQFHTPLWLDHVGSWISIIFLFLFGIVTFWNVLRSPQKFALPTSLRNYVSKKFIRKNFNPILIVLIGALFAFSFDTFSQVALFSLSARMLAGCGFAFILGVTFMVGMMLSDGMNGLFVSVLIRQVNGISKIVSRSFGLIIASFSLTVGMLNLSKMIYLF